jgi:hypothetical protein
MAVWPNGLRTAPKFSSLWKEYRGQPAPNHFGLDSYGYKYNCAIDDGEVIYIGWNTFGGGGREIWYRLSNGDVILYYHNAIDVLVSVGNRIVEGQRLGVQSDTGKAFGIHNHTEVWVNGRRDSRVDPLPYITALVGSSPAGGTIPATPTESDDDMPSYDLIATPDGTVWWSVDRVVRYAIPNQDALDTYKVFYKQKTGFTAKVVAKNDAQADAYGSPVFANPLSRYATPANVSASTKQILAAGGTGGGGSGTQLSAQEIAEAVNDEAAQRLKE